MYTYKIGCFPIPVLHPNNEAKTSVTCYVHKKSSPSTPPAPPCSRTAEQSVPSCTFFFPRVVYWTKRFFACPGHKKTNEVNSTETSHNLFLVVFVRKSWTERTHTADENAPPPSTTTAATTPTSSPKGARGGGGVSTTGGGSGAARRRQMAGDRAPPPSHAPTVVVDRHARRIHGQGGGERGVGDGGAAKSPLSSSRRLRGKICGDTKALALSPKERLLKGVFLAKTADRSAPGASSRGGSSPLEWGRSKASAVVVAGAVGSGPAVDSPQEAALVLERKVRLKGVLRSSRGCVILGVAMQGERGGGNERSVSCNGGK